MEEKPKQDGDGSEEAVTLEPRHPPSAVIGFIKKLAARSVTWVAVYLLGYFNLSFSWMLTPLLFSVLRDTWKKDKRHRLAAAREAALSNEQAMLESRMLVEDLPSWVYFPDKERAEWLNNVVKQLWPNVNTYVRKILFETVEPLVKSTLDEYKLKGFKFERDRVFLGRIPPRITGVKVYGDKHTSRHEIIMDVDLVYASDLEVVFSLKGISARLSEFSLRGMLRVVLKPLITDIPLIGGVQVYFLTVPEIDYSLGGVAGALEIPGLNKIVENIVLEQIRKFIVLPNKFFLPIVANLPMKDLKCPNTAGVLRVTLLRARDLMCLDVGFIGRKGTSDPYAILTVGATTYKTATKSSTCNPIWEAATYDFPIEVVSGQQLMMEFFDEDDQRDDEFLGRATMQTSVVADRGHIDGIWVDLEDCDSGKVQVSLSWLPVSDDPDLVSETASSPSATSSGCPGDDMTAKCILHIFIDSVTGLSDPKNPAYKPSPLVQLVCAKTVRQSWPKFFTTEPIVEQGFVMLIGSPHSDDIHVNVVDSNKNNKILATTTINVWSVIQEPGMEYPLQPWGLRGCKGSRVRSDAQVSLSVSVRGLLPPFVRGNGSDGEIIEESSYSGLQRQASLGSNAGSYEIKPGKLRVILHRATSLEKKDIGGKSDPYGIITYNPTGQSSDKDSVQKHVTPVCRKTLDPEWNYAAELDIPANGNSKVWIHLLDQDKVGKDEPLGEMMLDLRKINAAGGQLTKVWDVLSSCKTGKLLYSAEFIPEPEVSIGIASRNSVTSLGDGGMDVLDGGTPSRSPPDLMSLSGDVTSGKSVDYDDQSAGSGALSAGSLANKSADLGEGSAEDIPPVVSNSADGYGLEPQHQNDVVVADVVQQIEPDKSSEIISDESCVDDSSNQVDPLDDDSARRCEVRAGYLRVLAHKAIDLEKKDFTGKADPYVVAVYNGERKKSKSLKKTLNPEFGFETGFVVKNGGPTTIRIEVWDKDIGKDEPMGYTDFDVKKVVREGVVSQYWCKLMNAKSGQILLSFEFMEGDDAHLFAQPTTETDESLADEEVECIERRPSQQANSIVSNLIAPAVGVMSPEVLEASLTSSLDDDNEIGLRKRNLFSANGRIRITLIYDETKEELKVFIHEAAGLPGGDLPDPPDPYAKVYLMPGKRKKKKTDVIKDSGSPMWEEEFDFDMKLRDLPSQSIKVIVVDKKGVFARSPILGCVTVPLDNPGIAQGVADWYPLQHTDDDSD